MANGDNSDLDLSDSEDSPDGAEANEQCDGILGKILWTSIFKILLHPTSVPLIHRYDYCR